MPCILPVSDLRNYNEVLQNVSEESPVFLTKTVGVAMLSLTLKNTNGW